MSLAAASGRLRSERNRMERRSFLKSCAVMTSAGAVATAARTWAAAAPRRYERARLVDIHGAPFKARALPAETNYVFNYPYASTPCFLLNLGRTVAATAELARE